MSLITVPRLPDATEQYDRHQMSQMFQTLEQMIFVLNNTYVPETLRNDDEAFAFFMGDSPSTALASIESDISTNTTNIATNVTNITTNANAITSADSNITTLQAQVSTLQKQVRYLLATK